MMQKNNSRSFFYPIKVLLQFWERHKYPVVRLSALTASTPVLCSALTTTSPTSGLLGFGVFFLIWGFVVSLKQ
jgi:hypothetical protein